MKLNRRQLRRLIERVVGNPDGTTSLTEPVAAIKLLVQKIAENIRIKFEENMAAGRPVAISDGDPANRIESGFQLIDMAMYSGKYPEASAHAKEYIESLGQEAIDAFERIMQEARESSATLMYAFNHARKELAGKPEKELTTSLPDPGIVTY